MFAERNLLIKVLQVDKWSVSASISRQLDIYRLSALGCSSGRNSSNYPFA